MKTAQATLIGLLLLSGATFAEGSLIRIDAIIEGSGSGPVGTIGETMDYLTFELRTAGDVRITGTDLSANRMLTLAGYIGRDDHFAFIGSPYELADNYPSSDPPMLERTLDAGTYVVVVITEDDSPYDLEGFVPVYRGGGQFSIAPYSFEVSGDVRALEFWEGQLDPQPYGSFTITYIPEPATLAYICIGAALFWARRTKMR